jgi:hypothetical protein
VIVVVDQNGHALMKKKTTKRQMEWMEDIAAAHNHVDVDVKADDANLTLSLSVLWNP